MEKQTDLEAKYQKLATEYSKVRSQATVLKKAVLDEQAKSSEFKEVIRTHEQTIRKHDQEMESLTFRNEQEQATHLRRSQDNLNKYSIEHLELTKRISVLQQELQINSHSKKGKQKFLENSPVVNPGILDEEFQKKILENAQLLSSISDKDIEITTYKERIEWLEEKVTNLEKELKNRDELNRGRLGKLQKENDVLSSKIREMTLKDNERRSSISENDEKVAFLKAEAEKLKSECELLRSKPTSNEQLTEYYESQLRDMLDAKTLALSETKSLFAENQALKSRLENINSEHTELQSRLDKSYEELVTTNENYRSQLDAMTEHLAAQNEKITQQCDEIQILKHKLSTKK